MQELLSLNKLPVNVAVLDPSGRIVGVNDSWREFANVNELRLADAGVGTNYFDVCSGAPLSELRQDLSSLLRGELDLVTTTYDCHSPTERRWCVMLGLPVSPRIHDGAALLHVNVTELVPLVFSAPELRRATRHLAPSQTSLTLQMIEDTVRRSVGEAMARSRDQAASAETDKLRLLSGRLSRRQIEILLLLGDGQPNAEIAAHLALSPNTVKLHVSDILKRLQVSSRTQAALLAAKFRRELRAMMRQADH